MVPTLPHSLLLPQSMRKNSRSLVPLDLLREVLHVFRIDAGVVELSGHDQTLAVHARLVAC